MIEVKVEGRGHKLEFTASTPDEAIRKVALFLKEFYPETYQRLFGFVSEKRCC